MDIIKLAKQVELLSQRAGVEMVIGGENQLKEFANLVLEEAANNLECWHKINWNVWDCAKAIREMKSKEE